MSRRQEATITAAVAATAVATWVAWRKWAVPLAVVSAVVVFCVVFVAGQVWVTAVNFYWPRKGHVWSEEVRRVR